MELKSLQDWVLVKQFKTVPNVVDVSVFGGPTREYQVRVDPAKLVSYGLSIGQVEQQLANNNVNAGGSFLESGMQQINVRAGRAGPHDARHRGYGHHRQERHAVAGQRHRRRRARPQDPAGPVRPGDSSCGWEDHRQRGCRLGHRCSCGKAPILTMRSRASRRR